MPQDLDPRSRARLTRALLLARAVLLWERSGAVWTPLALAAALVAVAGLWGAFLVVPAGFAAYAFAAPFLIAAVFAVRGALRVRWPTREEARARIEADSRLDHDPLSALEDAPATGDEALWALHRAKSAEAVERLRPLRMRVGLAAADPYALRYALGLAAALGLWANGVESADRASRAFDPGVRMARDSGVLVSTAAGWTASTVQQIVAGLSGAERPMLVKAEVQSRAQIDGRPRILPAESRP
ncbi:DUF4175 family protein [Caulobacter sp. 17J65-9]|uniref:DUF4175 family protein n=1 Tax=Caulobacter sp. 17J65-9 TaxID=2709382 RepID=UPI0013C9E81B|nr:DUF4175 family protein [Caulobacter sp. 17J65-9]NEX93629.1 DUF4175 domain-containing protein [Caulobacter sp. 17J65-9]